MLQREKKINNWIIVGYEPQIKNNHELRHELEEGPFNRKALKVEAKIKNAKKIRNNISRWKTGKKKSKYLKLRGT